MKFNLSSYKTIDTKSLQFKLWLYFGLFAAFVLVILWFLQIFFLQTYYQDMKARQILKIADAISKDYTSADASTFTSMIEEITQISYKNDMYVFMEFPEGIILTSCGDYPPTRASYKPLQDINLIKHQVTQSPTHTVSFTAASPSGEKDTMIYGSLITNNKNETTFLCIFAPLSPVEATVDILANQLIYVTIISLTLAFVFSLLLSRRVTKSIIHIKNSAAQLAKGNYNVTFDGGHYSEMIALADTLTYTSQELAKTSNLQKDLIANVSHDLRTPLTMVKSYAEMIRDLSGENPEKRNAHLQVIIDEADRLNLLVSDLLTISKMQSGVEALQIHDFDLKSVVASLLQTYLILEEQEGYQFEFNCNMENSESYIISGDETRLTQVVSNLLNNAIRYGGDSKHILVTLNRENEWIRLSVTDFGQGILPEELDHIWDRYYKASSNRVRSLSGGSGLGLSIVKEILLLHKAHFGVESKEGEGSTFWFEIEAKKMSNK
ncbi:MAG: ATP-binding protein [Anaerovorax sp.]|nr:ATP-binding protein [Anaerovorax sp.]